MSHTRHGGHDTTVEGKKHDETVKLPIDTLSCVARDGGNITKQVACHIKEMHRRLIKIAAGDHRIPGPRRLLQLAAVVLHLRAAGWGVARPDVVSCGALNL